MNPTILPRFFRLLAALALIGLLSACAGSRALEESRNAFASGSPEAALRGLQDKVAADPRNLELRTYYLRQRDMLTVRQLAVAEQARSGGRAGRGDRCAAGSYAPEPPTA